LTSARTPTGDGVARADVKRIVAMWKGMRRTFGDEGPFLFGSFTIADAMFAPVVLRFRTYGVPLDGPALDYANAILAMPEIVEWDTAARADPHVMPKVDALLG